MKAIFKKLDITGIAVLLLVLFVAVGFTNAKTEFWYSVEIIDDGQPHDAPSNLRIAAPITGTPTYPCDETAVHTMCAIRLEPTGSLPSLPTNVQEALDLEEDEDLEELQFRYKLD